MATFSAVDAAVSGLRLAMARPRVIALWALAMTGFSIVVSAITILMMGPALMRLEAAEANGDADPGAALGDLAALAPGFALLLGVYILYYGVIAAAVNRMVLRPDEPGGFAYFKFGGDEMRLALVGLIQGLALGGVYFLGIVAVAVAVAVGGMGAPALGVVLAVLGGLALVALLIFLLVRFSLAIPQSFATRSINVFGTWKLSAGRFWPMLGTYALTCMIAGTAYLLMLALQTGVSFAIGGGFAGVGQIFNPDTSSLQAFFTPSMIVYVVLGGIVSAVVTLVMYAPAATIYRDIAQPKAAELFA